VWNDAVSVELVHGGHDALLEFLFGCDSDVAQDGAGELGEETFDEIEPGAVLGREGEFESTGRLLGELRQLDESRASLLRQSGEHAPLLDRLGGIDAMLQGVPVARRRAAAGPVHPTDARPPHGRRAAL